MKSKKETKRYFGEEEENAVRQYLLSPNDDEKKQLFNTHIHKAFDKLSENIINTYKFYNTGYNYETLKDDVVSFLVQKLDYFNPHRKERAFSYFGTVAKHYLTQMSRKRDRLTYYTEISDVEDNIAKNHHTPSNDKQSEIIVLFKDSIIENLPRIKSRDDRYYKFLKSLLLVLQTYNNLEYMNRVYLKIYVKESSGLTDKQISKYLYKVKKDLLTKVYKKYLNNSL
jgi:hypothetical protein